MALLNPVQKTDLVAIMRLTPNERRLRVMAAFLGYDLKAFTKMLGLVPGTHGRFQYTRAYRMKVAAALDVPYSVVWED